MYQVPSTFWAKCCLLLSQATVEGHIGESNQLHPLVAFTMFLTFEARCYVVDGREHSKRLKQRYDDEAEHEDTVTEAVTPIEEPSKITNTTSSMIDLQAMQFVDIYKERTSSQRMNWKRCYDQGVKESKLTRYATISSLRVTYNEYKKRK
ncbi:hypothetical protein RO3G_08668 [Rhizopus delemar RA 99-880]|uniref:Uncharacterized protein n=1 Tax=Rhizopus delemar (strain RA 99-880 / ATCC MYA-4621 / FGSC 9543 / NRRL 43880) TaxID=246409 RepID=I1C683_RHIO9|nr:hypothetical protein RO3G_08668 [Rhizopus delemar RA 99-880]|eukprot:EIE83963.1 hypothetical protein RO3G_08668 [Rhizopus delemar RA 99-880]